MHLYVLVGLAALVVHCDGSTTFHSSSCYLVDIDMFYNATKPVQINLTEIDELIRQSPLEHFVTDGWPKGEKICGENVHVFYRNVIHRNNTQNRNIILAGVFSYEFQGLGEDDIAQSKIFSCINATIIKYNAFVKEQNFITALPKLRTDSGNDLPVYATTFGSNIRFCCEEDSCCENGSKLVQTDQRNYCECSPGYYYQQPNQSKCYPCPEGTYQPKPGMASCRPCPDDTTTIGEVAATSCISSAAGCESHLDWTVEGVFAWEYTTKGARRKHACPYGPVGINVERECLSDLDFGVRWGKLNTSSCTSSARTASLLRLSQEHVTTPNAVNVSERLVDNTKDMTDLNAYDVALVTASLDALISVEDSLIEITVCNNVMKTLNNILMIDDWTLIESQAHNRTTTRLLDLIEKFSENVPLLNGSRSLMVTNIGIFLHSPTIQMANTGASFNMDGTKMLANITGSTKQQSYMTISSKAFELALQQGSKRLITIVYNNTKLFPVINKSTAQRVRLGKVPKTGTESPVGSVVMAGRFEKVHMIDVAGAVELNFVTEVQNKRELPLCVYWDFESNDGFGNWSSEGFSFVGTSAATGYVKCRCNHMTNFAMLLTADQERYESDENHRQVLNVISYVGCVISLVGALLTLVTYTLFRLDTHATAKVINSKGELVDIKYLRRSNAQIILCHLCVSLIGLLISFFVVASRTPRTTDCRAISIIVHYFLLVMFAWMAVEGVNMYLAFVKVMSAHVPRFMWKAIAVAWGAPVIIVVITAAVAFDDYSSEKSCFLHGIAFYVSVFTPVVVVLVSNLLIFGLTMYSLSQMGKNVSQENKVQGCRRIKAALAIMILLGLTWGFGILAIGGARLVFQYFFCVFNSLQGFAIFWFHCLRQPEVRQCWLDFLRGKGSRNRKYTASSTVPAIKKSSNTASPNTTPDQRSRTDTRDQQQCNADLNFNNPAV